MKCFLRALKWVSITILGLALLVLLLLLLGRDAKKIERSEADKKAIKALKEYHSEVDSNLYYSLLEEYGKNKKLAEGFEYQCLLALSHSTPQYAL